MRSIGIWAPVLLVLCRLVQGFSTGGEWGGAAAFLVEYAPPGKRGFIGSMQQFSVGLALIAGTLSAAVLNSTLDKQAMIDWGWRFPFILGFVLAPIGLYLRARVSETPAFDRPSSQKSRAAPVRERFTIYRRPVLAAFGLSIVGMRRQLHLQHLPAELRHRAARTSGQHGLYSGRPLRRSC